MLRVLPRYLAREILAKALGVLAVVLGIFLVRRFGSLLGDSTEGALPLLSILHLLALRTVMALPSLLPVVFYVAVLLAVARLHRDNEMTALAACGVAPRRTRVPVILFSSVAAVVVGFLSFSLRPWAADRFEEVKDAAVRAADLASLAPGRFHELDAEGELVLFAEGRARDDDRALENVFVQDRSGGRLSILSSSRAIEHRDAARGDRLLQMLDGYRYDIAADGTELEITRYEEFVIRTPAATPEEGDAEQRARSVLELLGSSEPEDSAELQWRLAMPVSTMVLAVLALPLGRVDARRGRAAKLFLALLLYTAYRNLLSTTKTWISDGTVAALPGTWTVHAACLATAVLLMAIERRATERGAAPVSQRLAGWAAARVALVRARSR